jgi:hypothetical protein
MVFKPFGDVLQFDNQAGTKDWAMPMIPMNPDGSSRDVSSGVAAASVIRPADTAAYAAGDLIANSTTAGSVIPLTFAIARAVNRPVQGRRLRVKVNDAIWKAAIIRVHLFRDLPTVTVGDNGQLNNAETYAFSEADYLGFADVTLSQVTSDGFAKGFASISVTATPSTGTVNIFGLLETRSAVTPGSAKTFSVVFEAGRD